MGILSIGVVVVALSWNPLPQMDGMKLCSGEQKLRLGEDLGFEIGATVEVKPRWN